MFCPRCSASRDGNERFCPKCGANLPAVLVTRCVEGLDPNFHVRTGVATVAHKDPDELTGKGVASFFIGDGFFFPAIFLSVLSSSVQSWLWLLLLIPAFFFFGKGFSDVWQARQIRRRLKLDELASAPEQEAQASMSTTIKNGSSEVLSKPSVTERTTRQLK